MDASIETSEVNAGTVVTIGREIDIYTAPKLREALVELITAVLLVSLVDEGGQFLSHQPGPRPEGAVDAPRGAVGEAGGCGQLPDGWAGFPHRASALSTPRRTPRRVAVHSEMREADARSFGWAGEHPHVRRQLTMGQFLSRSGAALAILTSPKTLEFFVVRQVDGTG